jgi:phosphatidylglycerol lysyltransferase
LTPLASLDKPHTGRTTNEMVYQRIGTFKQYQTMRNFKEKYANYWINKYIIMLMKWNFFNLQALNKA